MKEGQEGELLGDAARAGEGRGSGVIRPGSGGKYVDLRRYLAYLEHSLEAEDIGPASSAAERPLVPPWSEAPVLSLRQPLEPRPAGATAERLEVPYYRGRPPWSPESIRVLECRAQSVSDCPPGVAAAPWPQVERGKPGEAH